jgi:hypothetical protein
MGQMQTLNPIDDFDARADFLPEDRLAPFVFGKKMPDWKSAFLFGWKRRSIPCTVLAGYALVVLNQKERGEYLAGENSILHFPDSDQFPRVDLRNNREKRIQKDGRIVRQTGPQLFGVDFVWRLFANLILDLRKGTLKAFGHELSVEGTPARTPRLIRPEEWFACGFSIGRETFKDDLYAYQLMDDAAHRGETLYGLGDYAKPALNLPLFRTITFDVESTVSLIEGGELAIEMPLLGVKLTAGEQAVYDVARRLWPSGKVPSGTRPGTRNNQIRAELVRSIGRQYSDHVFTDALTKTGFMPKRGS